MDVQRLKASRSLRFHLAPVAALAALCLLYWGQVLFGGRVLLPGDFLRGFSPFGADPTAPWNLLQWDALGQYYPWRLYAAQQLHLGHIPLWNPHQFSGTPFLANMQSAVFYPLNLPFWLMDVAGAFAVSALLHSLLAALGTYFYAIRQGRSRYAACLAGIAFAFGGYLSAWVVLPTLADTAAWLPLLLLLFERCLSRPHCRRRLACFAVAAACALLAGHPQIFFYLCCALLLRGLFHPRVVAACRVLAAGLALSLAVAAMQLLPTLELARVGHRAAAGRPTLASWHIVQGNALPPSQYISLLLPTGVWPSFSENFGYVGITLVLLTLCGLGAALWRKKMDARAGYSWALCLGGLAYALATPLAMLFYFLVPGLSLMGGTGRAFVLFNFGLALLAAAGLDALRILARNLLRGPSQLPHLLLPALALFLATAELFGASCGSQPTAARAAIYPPTRLTSYLQKLTARGGERILFITPQSSWLPREAFSDAQRTHPRGVLPPNGAMVYGLNDVSGYDSLSLRSYREFVSAYGDAICPPYNGNMVLLNNPNLVSLDQLNTRYVVSETPLRDAGELIKVVDGCYVYQRPPNAIPQLNGTDFAPGVRDGVYQPGSIRLGGFIALCALAWLTVMFARPRHD